MTFGVLSSVRDGSQSAVGGRMWKSENIYPSSVGTLRLRFHANRPYFPTTIYLVVVYGTWMLAAYACANCLRSFFKKDHTLHGPKQRCSNLFELLKGN